MSKRRNLLIDNWFIKKLTSEMDLVGNIKPREYRELLNARHLEYREPQIDTVKIYA